MHEILALLYFFGGLAYILIGVYLYGEEVFVPLALSVLIWPFIVATIPLAIVMGKCIQWVLKRREMNVSNLKR